MRNVSLFSITTMKHLFCMNVVIPFLPPASAVKVIESVPSVCLCVCVCVLVTTLTTERIEISVMYVCLCLCPSCQNDYQPKRLCMRGKREVSQRSGVFIQDVITGRIRNTNDGMIN